MNIVPRENSGCMNSWSCQTISTCCSTVGSEITIERAVQFIKGGFAFRAGRELGIRPPIWQKGFSEVRVSDFVAFTRQREYIRNNPVVAALELRAEEYPSSSAFPGYV